MIWGNSSLYSCSGCKDKELRWLNMVIEAVNKGDVDYSTDVEVIYSRYFYSQRVKVSMCSCPSSKHAYCISGRMLAHILYKLGVKVLSDEG